MNSVRSIVQACTLHQDINMYTCTICLKYLGKYSNIKLKCTISYIWTFIIMYIVANIVHLHYYCR